MVRLSSAQPWALTLRIAILFVLAWWIEDCLIFYVAWRQFAVVRLGLEMADKTHLMAAIGAAGTVLDACGRKLADAAGQGVAKLQAGFDLLPSHLRARAPFRFLAWCGGTLAATFGASATVNFGAGLLRAGGLAIRALVALTGGFWIANLYRRLNDALNRLFTLPTRFYSEAEAEHPAPSLLAADDLEPIDAPRGRGDGRVRRREYLQFFQGHVERIGIILGGGGARGAYQAGALKAIHEFLRDYSVLHKVKVIAGSSIGAWNAMFWLADLVAPPDADTAPTIESWWKSVRLNNLGDLPWFYLPLVSEGLLRPNPWRENFDATFGAALDEALGDHPPVHFYLTRTDGASGALHYATNWRGIADRVNELGKDRHPDYANFEILTSGDGDPYARTADSLFATLDLAPLFAPGAAGAADNSGALEQLPISLAAQVERCDLLFVLPLNFGADVADEPGGASVRRIARIAGAHKGALERAAIRGVDTVNRFIQRIERIEFGVNTMASANPPEGLADEALAGLREEIAEFNAEHKTLYLFTVCPAGRFELGTADFWKQKALREAFDLMYLQTKRELQNRFFEDIEPEDPHVVMVDGAVPEVDALPRPHYRRPSEL